MVKIKPDRNNWKQFCQEPPLTEAEWEFWNELAKVAQQNNSFFEFLFIETEEEFKAIMINAGMTGDWSDMVQWADANRALKRAEFKVYQEWLKRGKNETVS